jgi:beta-lactamase class D
MVRTARSSIMLRTLLVVLMASVCSAAFALSPKAAAPTATARFADYGHAGTFVLQRDGADPQTLHGADWATKPQPPASTFKVMLALIALETGALRSADEVVKWDGTPYQDKPEWQKDMALREAMQTSSEGYFGIVAKRIGRERLAEWVTRVGYGNGHVGPNAPMAWHDGVLTVTARQQLAFVDRLRRGALPFSAKTIATVKASILDSDINGRRIYGKTGTHTGNKTQPGIGWWIGWVEGGKAPTASFALGVELKTVDGRAKRIALGKQLLRDAGLLAAK